MTASPQAHVLLLLKALDQSYDHKSWHGPVLRGSLRGISAEQAAWRPAPSRHNIWELAVHAAYWKYSILRRLRRGEEICFPQMQGQIRGHGTVDLLEEGQELLRPMPLRYWPPRIRSTIRPRRLPCGADSAPQAVVRESLEDTIGTPALYNRFMF